MFKKNIVKVVILALICGVTLSSYADELPSLPKVAPKEKMRLLIKKMQKAVNPNNTEDKLFLSYNITVEDKIYGKLETYYSDYELFRMDSFAGKKMVASLLVDCMLEENSCGFDKDGKKSKLSKLDEKESQLFQAILYSPIDTLELCSKIELNSEIVKIEDKECYFLAFHPVGAKKRSSIHYVYVLKDSFRLFTFLTLKDDGTGGKSVYAIHETLTTTKNKRVIPKKVEVVADEQRFFLNLTEANDKANFKDDVFDADDIELEFDSEEIDFEENEIDLD